MDEVISDDYLKQPYSRAGISLLRKCLKTELRLHLHQTGRLFLMQCARKMERYKTKLPCFKTTRPIAITSVINKALDRILLSKIKPIILSTTSRNNAGFKPQMSC